MRVRRASALDRHLFSAILCTSSLCDTSLHVFIGAASCSVDPGGAGNERTNETERGSCRTSETISGSPQDSWEDAVTGTSLARMIGLGRAQEAPGADDGRFGFGASAARYQPESFSGEDT